jgi:hypothetical protein
MVLQEKIRIEPKRQSVSETSLDSDKMIFEAFGIEPHKLYPIEHVAEMLSVDRKLVRWWIKRGSIEGIKLPNRAWRIRGIEIVRMLEQGRKRTK